MAALMAKKDTLSPLELGAYGRGGARLEDRVCSGIVDDIRLGRYAIGERLPSENTLASMYGVSRPIVRAALAKLRDDGLVVSKRGAGSFVSSGEHAGSAFEPLRSIEDIGHYFEYRKVIEGETAARAAARGGGAPVPDLRHSVDQLRDRLADGAARVHVDFDFHMLIANLSDNRFLTTSVALLRPHWFFIGKFVRSLSGSVHVIRGRSMLEEHVRILEAIEAGDPEAARESMIRHVIGSEQRVFKNPLS